MSNSVRLRSVRVITAFISILLFLSSNDLVAQGKTPPPQKRKLAVLPFDARGGLTPEEADLLSGNLESAISQTGEFILVDRGRIKSLLQEQSFQQSAACSQTECIVEAGRILKVDLMVAGTVGRLGKRFQINVKVIDVATAEIITTKQDNQATEIEDLSQDVIPNLAADMVSQLTGKERQTSGGSKWLWYVGGVAVLGGVAYAVLNKPKAGDEGSSLTPLPTLDFP